MRMDLENGVIRDIRIVFLNSCRPIKKKGQGIETPKVLLVFSLIFLM